MNIKDKINIIKKYRNINQINTTIELNKIEEKTRTLKKIRAPQEHDIQ